jgi:hypothetical protein
MMSRPTLLIALLLLAAPIHAQIYQCDRNGSRVFSDRPCGEDTRLFESRPALSFVPPDETLPAQAESARQFIAERRERLRRRPKASAPDSAAALVQSPSVHIAPWRYHRSHDRYRPGSAEPAVTPRPQRYSPLNGPILGTRGREPYRVRLTDPAGRGAH